MQNVKKYSIDNFYRDDLNLNILDREMPYNSNKFFKTLISEPFEFNFNKFRNWNVEFFDIILHLCLPNE